MTEADCSIGRDKGGSPFARVKFIVAMLAVLLASGCDRSRPQDELGYRVLFDEGGVERHSPSADLALELVSSSDESRNERLIEICERLAGADGYSRLVVARAIVRAMEADPEMRLPLAAAQQFAKAAIQVRPGDSIPLIVDWGQESVPGSAARVFDPNCAIDVEGSLHQLKAGLPDGWEAVRVVVTANDRELLNLTLGQHEELSPLFVRPSSLWDVVDMPGDWKILTRCEAKSRGGHPIVLEGEVTLRVVDQENADLLREE